MGSVNNHTGRKARFLCAETDTIQFELTLTDGNTRIWETEIPVPAAEAEAAACRVLFTERVGNLLACLGGQKLKVYPGRAESLRALLSPADSLIRKEKGCARAIRVADRINAALSLPPFYVEVTDKPFPPPKEKQPPARGRLAEKLRKKASLCLHGIRLGIDVGGTDIKAVAFCNGRLAAVKEFDWSPASCRTPEEIMGPVVTIAKLLIASAQFSSAMPENIQNALRKDASVAEMQAAAAPYASTGCASIGLSYPDVIIRDRIVGGETPKTQGMQEYDPEHYEEALLRLGSLREQLAALLIPGGTLHIANDGNIAAFTAAAELSFCEPAPPIDEGVFAHSLGTDLGTGLLLGNGMLSEAPLELYTFRTGTEDAQALAFPPADVRSARTVHSGLRGAERQVGQAAAFRYAYELAPRLLKGYVEEKDGMVCVITAPEDKRKALLEHLMACADAGDKDAEQVFLRIGKALANITSEAETLLSTGMKKRYVFGRFVKQAHVFALIEKGFTENCPGFSLIAADSALAKSPLMLALAAEPSVTVAQFGQAVGAVYFGA